MGQAACGWTLSAIAATKAQPAWTLAVMYRHGGGRVVLKLTWKDWLYLPWDLLRRTPPEAVQLALVLAVLVALAVLLARLRKRAGRRRTNRQESGAKE
jgi:hypothetical protein